jgi:hypothetical protein
MREVSLSGNARKDAGKGRLLRPLLVYNYTFEK